MFRGLGVFYVMHRKHPMQICMYLRKKSIYVFTSITNIEIRWCCVKKNINRLLFVTSDNTCPQNMKRMVAIRRSHLHAGHKWNALLHHVTGYDRVQNIQSCSINTCAVRFWCMLTLEHMLLGTNLILRKFCCLAALQLKVHSSFVSWNINLNCYNYV